MSAAAAAAVAPNVTVVSAEGERFSIPRKVAEMSALLKLIKQLAT